MPSMVWAELPHDVRLLGIAEVQAIGRRDRRRAGAGHVARRLGHGVHRAQLGIEIAPAAVAVERHRQAALRALHADHARLAAGPSTVLVCTMESYCSIDPALGADVRAGQQLLQIAGESRLAARAATSVRHLARNGRLPALQGTVVQRRLVGQRLVGNFRDDLAVLQHAHRRLGDDAADGDGIESPLLEDAEDFVFAALLGDQQHALLRLAQHDLVGSHAGVALRHQIEFDLQANAAAPAHLAGRAGQAGGAHVLDADDRAGLHGFEAGFEQQLLQERIAHLHIGPLGLGFFAELLARHGGAVDAVAPGLRADVDHRIPCARRLGIKNLVASHQPERERVHQRIAVSSSSRTSPRRRRWARRNSCRRRRRR